MFAGLSHRCDSSRVQLMPISWFCWVAKLNRHNFKRHKNERALWNSVTKLPSLFACKFAIRSISSTSQKQSSYATPMLKCRSSVPTTVNKECWWEQHQTRTMNFHLETSSWLHSFLLHRCFLEDECWLSNFWRLESRQKTKHRLAPLRGSFACRSIEIRRRILWQSKTLIMSKRRN